MYALVDCNNFYASCERIFNPRLIGKPVVILSNNDGCVIARSNEAKPFVPMGAPAYKYEDCFSKNNIAVYSSNYALYGDFSNRVMNILGTYTPDVEIYSIDEAFLQFRGFERYNFVDTGLQMVKQVRLNTQIPISVGFAPTKALAKIANKIAKKFPERTSGVYVINNDDKRIKALRWTKIKDVWGIGRSMYKHLNAIGIQTAYDFIQLSDDYVRNAFSITGLRLKKELQGISVIKLEQIAPRHSMRTARSFASTISDYAELEERINAFASNCCKRLRSDKLVCQALTVFIRTNSFSRNEPKYSNSITLKLPYASNTEFTIGEYARVGLKEIFKEGYKYKKAGVLVLNITKANVLQTNLFYNENPKYNILTKVMDSVNAQHGKRKLMLANQNLERQWTMKQERLSKRFTTCWNELLEVQ